MYSVCVMKHFLERGVSVIHILEEPSLGELWLGQGLCKGLGISLHEVVVLELITSGEVGLVTRLHLLLSKYAVLLLPSRLWKKCSRNCRRLKEKEEKKKLSGMESSKSKSNAHCMYG